MDVIRIIGNLEAKNVTLSLAIDFEGVITPEAEKLLRELSQNKQAAIDVLAGRRYVPLPDNIKLPPEFRSERMKQIRDIFAKCYNLLEKYECAKTEEQWRDIHNYHEVRLDGNDPLAVSLFTACVEELHRQYKSAKDGKHYGH